RRANPDRPPGEYPPVLGCRYGKGTARRPAAGSPSPRRRAQLLPAVCPRRRRVRVHRRAENRPLLVLLQAAGRLGGGDGETRKPARGPRAGLGMHLVAGRVDNRASVERRAGGEGGRWWAPLSCSGCVARGAAGRLTGSTADRGVVEGREGSA